MGTRRKLLLGALGFVAATTTLVFWQTAPPPKIERVARRVPLLDNCEDEIHWLSSDELLFEGQSLSTHSPRQHAQILNLQTGQLRSLPVSPNPRSYGVTFTHEQPYRENPLPSPDGKWLLYEEGEYSNGESVSSRRTGWFLVRSDGSEKRTLPAPTGEKNRFERKTLWFPDSSGWYVAWGNYRGFPGVDASYQNWLDRYNLSGKRVSSQRIKVEPKGVQADGRLLFSGGSWDNLCRPDFLESCEGASAVHPEDVEEALLNTEALSYDTRSCFMIFTVKNKPIPEQDFWAALFNHHFPEEHREFWLVARDGKQSYCLATDDVSNIVGGDSNWKVLSWSPNGKRVLLSRSSAHSMSTQVYLLELAR